MDTLIIGFKPLLNVINTVDYSSGEGGDIERSVAADGGGHRGTILGIHGAVNDGTVRQRHGPSLGVLRGESVLAPVLLDGEGGLAREGLGVVELIDALLEVLACMRTAALSSKCVCQYKQQTSVRAAAE